jgi:hypothetical protein
MIMVLTPLELSSDFNDFCLLDPHLLGTLAAAHKNTSHQKIQFKISAVKKRDPICKMYCSMIMATFRQFCQVTQPFSNKLIFKLILKRIPKLRRIEAYKKRQLSETPLI